MESQTLREFLLDTYAPLKGLNGRTIEIYDSTLNRFRECLGREPLVSDLTDVAISRFLRWRLETPNSRGQIPRRTTVLKDRVQLLALASLAFRKRRIEEDVVLPQFRAAGRLPRGYLREEVERLIADAARRRGSYAGRPAAWWWKTIIWWSWETGCRIGETLQLRWEYVDLADRRAVLIAETRKLKTRDLEKRFSPALAEELAKQHRPGELVWPWDRCRTSVWVLLAKACQRCKIEPRGFHGFRKAAASYYAAAGGNPVDLLDHSDGGQLYQRHYRDSRIATGGPSPVDLIPPLSINGSPDKAPEQSPHRP